MKYLLHGDDSIALRFRKQELIEAFYKEHAQGQVRTFSFPEVPGELAPEEELSLDLFAQPKLLIFEDLSKLYETASERATEIIHSETPHTCIFVEYQKFLKASPFLKLASKAVQKEEIFESKKRDIKKLIHALEVELGVGELDQRTITAIKERVGEDDELLLQNIRKILTFTAGKSPTAEELNELVPAPMESKIFDALDALALGQKDRALVLFQNILKTEDIFRIFPLCAWQIRQMLLVTEARETLGERKDAIAKETSIHPFVVQKVLRVLPKFSRPRLAKGLRILSSLDVELKQGQKTPEGALQQFIFHW